MTASPALIRRDALRPRRRPRILVTIGRDLPDRPVILRLPSSYVSALIVQDAVPILMPAGIDLDTIQDFVGDVDGLLLPGGVDPHPRYFDEDIHPMTVIDEELDALELATIDVARQARLPILGICRGMQILNVALGGSLIQHLVTTPIDHKPDGALDRHVHRVEFAADTRLRRLSDTDRLAVNSWHHQAVGRVGAGLRIAAVAEDGVVEALESSDSEVWIVGVQYHPEELTHTAAHRALLVDFVSAARTQRTRR